MIDYVMPITKENLESLRIWDLYSQEVVENL